MTAVRSVVSLVLLMFTLLNGCQPSKQPPSSHAPDTTAEQPIRPLPLRGLLAQPDAEVSGLTWYNDWLILLPQYPRHGFTETEGRLYAIARSRIEQTLADSMAPPIEPRAIPLRTDDLDAHMPTFQGCEAIAFVGNQLFVLVEARAKNDAMRSYLLRGHIAPDLSKAHLQASTARSISITTDLPNMSAEAVSAVGDTLVVLQEANGANVNPHPQVRLFDRSLRPLGTRPFPTIEYRITDATSTDVQGRFWAMNYFFPGERMLLQPALDSLVARYGTGASHRRRDVVERIVEFRYTARGVVRTDTPPLPLVLAPNGESRNWEGLARLDDRGFLVVTDRFPETILAFVPAR